MSAGTLLATAPDDTPVPAVLAEGRPATSLWGEARDGMAATRLFVALRWRMVRSRAARVAISVGMLVLLGGLLLAINLGYAVQLAAQQGDTTSGVYAQIWIDSLRYGTMGSLGAFVVGGAIIVALFAPFTGTSTLALIPTEDLEGIRPPRVHRYFDSLLLNFVSGIGLLQLIALTAVTSLLTLDGTRLPALLLTWTVWSLLICLTTTVGWALEWVQRRWGKTRRRLIGAVGVGLLAVAVLLDPNHGSTLFGAATGYAQALRLGVAGWSVTLVALIAGVVLAAAALLVAGVAVTRSALGMAAPSEMSTRKRRWRPMGTHPDVIASRLMIRTLWRTLECRRPVAAILIFGVPAMMLAKLDQTSETTLILAVPLAIALAWGVNVFGVLGTGMTWLASQPFLLERLLRAAAFLQFLLTGGLLILLWGIAAVSGNASDGSALRLLSTGGTATVLITAASVDLAVRKPRRTRLSGRGDALVPPLTALGYMGRLVGLALYPSLVVALPIEQTTMAALLGGALVAAVLLLAYRDRRWRDPHVRAKVISAVSPA